MITFLKEQPRSSWFSPLTIRDRLLIAYIVGAFVELASVILHDLGALTGLRWTCLFASLVLFVAGAILAMRGADR